MATGVNPYGDGRAAGRIVSILLGRSSHVAGAAGDGALGLGGDALPELESALVGALGDQGAAADPAQHRAAFEVLEVLADGDSGYAEPAAQLTDLDAAVRTFLTADRLPAVVPGARRSVFPVGPASEERITSWFVAADGDCTTWDTEVGDTVGELVAITALDRARRGEGLRIVEARTDRAENAAVHAALRDAVRAAVRAVL